MSRDKSIKDYDSVKVNDLKSEVVKVLAKEGEIYNYDMKDKVDWSEVGWTKGTGEKVLVHMRRDLNEKDLIEIKEDGEGIAVQKKWKPKDIDAIKKVDY